MTSCYPACTPLVLPVDPQADCRVWLIDLRHPIDEAAWQACVPEEHARAARFKFEIHATRYRAAHACMRQLLAHELALPLQLIDYAAGANGKPGLSRPGAEGLHFNLSHSGDWALLGMSRTHHIGVDIECHRPMDDMASVAKQVFNEAELQAFLACDPALKAQMFYRLWVVKEACLKALGSGLSVDPRCVSGGWSSQPQLDPHPHPASAWAPARIELPDAVMDMQVQGLMLPIQDESVEGAVALWPPQATPA